jgi:hypothetical protein
MYLLSSNLEVHFNGLTRVVNRHPKLTHYRRPILTHQWFIGLIPVGPHGGPPGDNIPLGSPPVLHSVAVISGFYDFAMMGQPV